MQDSDQTPPSADRDIWFAPAYRSSRSELEYDLSLFNVGTSVAEMIAYWNALHTADPTRLDMAVKLIRRTHRLH